MVKKKNFETGAEIEAEVTNAANEIAELAAEIEALKKEVALLKTNLDKKPVGGSDPRVDKIFEALKKSPNFFLSKELL